MRWVRKSEVDPLGYVAYDWIFAAQKYVGMFTQKYFLWVWLVLFSSAHGAAVESLSRFLEAASFQVLTDAAGEAITVDPLSPQLPFERYAVVDPHGSRHVLNLTSPAWVMEHVAVHRFLEALGVHHIPAYPVFVRRGQNGVPNAAEAKRLGQQDHDAVTANSYGRQGANGEWILGFLQPEWVDLHPLEISESGHLPPLNLHQLEALAEAFVAVHALRADGYQVRFINGQPFLMYVTGPFRNTEKKTAVALERNFWDRRKGARYYPVEQLQALDQNQVNHFVRHTSLFLSRLETMKSVGQHLQIFGEYFAELDRIGNLTTDAPDIYSNFALKRLFETTIDNIRMDFTKYLRERVRNKFRLNSVGPTQGVTLPALPVKPPFLGQPRWNFQNDGSPLPSIEDRSVRQGNGKHILLALALSTPEVRARILATWATPSFDPIATLLSEATQENTIHPIYTDTFPGSSRFENADPPQFFVNFNAPKTLLVVSPNDPEGRLIQQIGMRLGPYLNIEVFRGLHNQGDYISEDDAYDIISHTQGEGFARIVLCEFGDTKRRTMELLRIPGVELIHLDHHQARLHRFSTAEQFFRLYNYHPSLSEWLVGVRDRAGMHGFRDFGYDVEAVARYATAYGNRNTDNLLRNYRPFFAGRADQVFELEYDGPVESLSTSFALLTYPEISNVLALGRQRVRFLGFAPVVLALHKQFESSGRTWRNRQYIGGDPTSVMYWTVRTDGEQQYQQATRLARETIAAAPELKDFCWNRLAYEGGTPFPKID